MAEMKAELVAPCGMNCGLCSAYLAYTRGLPKRKGMNHCAGCMVLEKGPLNRKNCAFVKKRCAKVRKGQVRFCSECDDFPCHSIEKLDERYRKRWNYSFVENLECIRDEGVEAFLRKQEEKYRCPKCGDAICVHNGKCYNCDEVKSWKG